jgi:hypothetical protein
MTLGLVTPQSVTLEDLTAAGGPVEQTRADLALILRGAGLEVAMHPTTRFAAPIAVLQAGEPWLEPTGLGRGFYTVRWRIWLLAGASDGPGAHALATGMAAVAVLAIGRAQGWSSTDASGDKLLRVAGVEGGYIGSELSAHTVADIRRVEGL